MKMIIQVPQIFVNGCNSRDIHSPRRIKRLFNDFIEDYLVGNNGETFSESVDTFFEDMNEAELD